MFSIDQNCHSLWDVLPKLQALQRRAEAVTHFVEDIDAAFTALGAEAGSTAPLQLARERYHHSGGADWGAALFYSEFLGRLPADPADWEPITGLKTSTLARQLGRTVKDLYDEFSPGDNWQLIGPSYVGDRQHHRIIGDLTTREVRPFLLEILRKGKADMLRRFPAAESQRRLKSWFDREERLLDELLTAHAAGSLVELYRDWLQRYLHKGTMIRTTSELFSLASAPRWAAPLEIFLREYDQAAGLYNQAIVNSAAKLRPLRLEHGELPFFAILRRDGHAVRTPVYLRGRELVAGSVAVRLLPDGRLPLKALESAGIRCLAGKAVILVLQATMHPHGRPLALPYRGSVYMPVVARAATELVAAGLLEPRFHPIVRVRFHLLDRMRDLDTPILLPPHLAQSFGREEISARHLATNYADLAAEANQRLTDLASEEGRRRWQQRRFPEALAEIDALDARRRQLARRDPKSPEIRELWRRTKTLQTGLLEAMVRQIAIDVQARDIDYWDSRGALLPWSIALGGEEFYESLLARAEVYREPLIPEGDHA